MNRGSGGMGELTGYVIHCALEAVDKSIDWEVKVHRLDFERGDVVLKLHLGEAFTSIYASLTEASTQEPGAFLAQFEKRVRKMCRRILERESERDLPLDCDDQVSKR